ncbi:hypothetical protein ACFE04_029201 [Oxalis oulophora]
MGFSSIFHRKKRQQQNASSSVTTGDSSGGGGGGGTVDIGSHFQEARFDIEEIKQNLKEAFSVYDIDGNGSITAEELHEVMKSLGDQCTIAECRKMISGVDSDGDGTINFEEFKVMMLMGARYDAMEIQRQQPRTPPSLDVTD